MHDGILLAPHLDAAFDRGFITVTDDGKVIVSSRLDAAAREVLGLTERYVCAASSKTATTSFCPGTASACSRAASPRAEPS